MADNTGIEWVVGLAKVRRATPATWNMVDGCSRESTACHNCWSAGLVHTRLSRSIPARYQGLTDLDGTGTPRFTGEVRMAWHAMDTPLTQSLPRVYFAPSMADLFHARLAAKDIATVVGTMVAAVHLHGHLFITLTKRTERMADLTNDDTWWEMVNAVALYEVKARRRGAAHLLREHGRHHPPPGLWFGTSVEDQPSADARLPHLRRTPTVCRVVSAEPLLRGFDLSPWLPALGWVIAGEESGKGARPTADGDAPYRALRDQCAAAGVAFFLKQRREGRRIVSMPLLDGVQHDAVPEAAHA